MRITLSQNQMQQLREDMWLEVKDDESGFGIYVEVGTDGQDKIHFLYGEFRGKLRKDYCVNYEDLEKLKPRRPNDPSWYHNDPLCPSCGTYMIYHFDHCPKCGQKLDWSEKGSL